VFARDVPQGGEVLTEPAVWVNPADHSTWVFVANDSGLSGLKLHLDGGGNPSLVKQWQVGGGTSPIVANGVLFYAGGGSLWALDPTSGAQLWQNTQIGGVHWESPIVANGLLYATDEDGYLSAYWLGAPNFPDHNYLPLIRR